MVSSPPAAGTFLLATAVLWVSSLSQEESTSDENGIRGRVDPSRQSVKPSPYQTMFGEMDSEMERSEDTHLNCFVKSSSTSSSSQLSCQSGSAFPPDALFSDSNTLPDCSATSQLNLSTFLFSTHNLEEFGRHTSSWEILIVSLTNTINRKGRKRNIPQTHHHPPKRPTGVISSSLPLSSFPLMVLLHRLLPSHSTEVGVCWIPT